MSVETENKKLGRVKNNSNVRREVRYSIRYFQMSVAENSTPSGLNKGREFITSNN